MTQNLKVQPDVIASFQEQIRNCLQLLHDFRWGEGISKSKTCFDFMRSLLDLYLNLQLHPPLQSDSNFEAFLKQSAPLIVSMSSDEIIDFKMSITKLFDDEAASEYYYDPWPEVCWRRSAFEALKELYQNTQDLTLKECFELFQDDFDTEDVDYLIEYKATNKTPVHESDIPPGMPRSHWWWWGERAEDVEN
jgi:hypothetical protein